MSVASFLESAGNVTLGEFESSNDAIPNTSEAFYAHWKDIVERLQYDRRYRLKICAMSCGAFTGFSGIVEYRGGRYYARFECVGGRVAFKVTV